MRVTREVSVEPWAAGFLAGLLVILLVSLALGTSGCMQPGWIPGSQGTVLAQRGVTTQVMSAVYLRVICMGDFDSDDTMTMHVVGGSGVILDDTHVMTAFHAVDCDAPALVSALLRDGRTYWLTVEKSKKSADLALLTTMEGDKFSDDDRWKPIMPVTSVQATKGKTVCFEHASPTRGRSCGKVTEVVSVPRQSPDYPSHRTMESDVRIDNKVQHGNSGSGVYDEDGNLVGIITERIPFQETGGRFTSLWNNADMLPQ